MMDLLKFSPQAGLLVVSFVLTVALKQGNPEIRHMERNRYENKYHQLQDLSQYRRLLIYKLLSESTQNTELHSHHKELNTTRDVNHRPLNTPGSDRGNQNTSSRKRFHVKMKNSENKMLVQRGKQQHHRVVQENTDFSKSRKHNSANSISHNSDAILIKFKPLDNSRHKGVNFTNFVISLRLLRQHEDVPILRNYFLKYIYPREINLGAGYNSSKQQINRESKSVVDHAFSAMTTREITEKKKIRRKRFLFMDPAEISLMPSMFSIMMGTAQDPNTGKRIEFGGDVMRDMMVNAFLPPGARPPPGKEPGELIQMMAPVWYFNRLNRVMVPRSRTSSRNINQMRNQQGYYGETMQGKRRRRKK